MGILNATPDSFSGDGLLREPAALRARAEAQVRDGAAILDVGGESTRPGAIPVGLDEELARALPVVRAVRDLGLPVSIDTSHAAVAEAALDLGATIVNDVSGLADPTLALIAAEHAAWLVVMHNGWRLGDEGRGDVVLRVGDALAALVDRAVAAGVPAERVIVDPGLGFGKSAAESLTLVRRLGELRARFAGQPLLVGPSRKRFIAAALGGAEMDDRLEGTLAVVALAVAAGADLIRVHDVRPAVRAARAARAVAGPA